MTGGMLFCAAVIGGLYALMSGKKLDSETMKGYFFAGFFTYLLLHYGGVWMFDRFLQAFAPGYVSSTNNPFINFVTFPIAIVASMVIYGPIKRFGKRLENTPEQLKKEKEAIEAVKQVLKRPKPQKTGRYNKSER